MKTVTINEHKARVIASMLRQYATLLSRLDLKDEDVCSEEELIGLVEADAKQALCLRNELLEAVSTTGKVMSSPISPHSREMLRKQAGEKSYGTSPAFAILPIIHAYNASQGITLGSDIGSKLGGDSKPLA